MPLLWFCKICFNFDDHFIPAYFALFLPDDAFIILPRGYQIERILYLSIGSSQKQ